MTQLCACGCGEPAPIARYTNKRLGHVKGEPLRYVRNHQHRKSAVRYVLDDVTGCWVWQGAMTHQGYGHIMIGGRLHKAHRVYYEQANGSIPAGLTIDHLCRNPSCVNPGHMEPVTLAENVRRARALVPLKTHCHRGHPFDEDNTGIRGRWRFCRECRRINERARRRESRLYAIQRRAAMEFQGRDAA